VRDFLAAYEFHGRARFFREITPFLDWFAQNETKFDRWNVVVAGRVAADKAEKNWRLPSDLVIGKVNRSRLKPGSDTNSVSIGALRDPKDLLADAASPPEMPNGPSNLEIVRFREEAGLGNTPQLLLYRVDKDSTPVSETDDRTKLGTEEDLIGISIWLPGRPAAANHSFSTHVSVKIPPELKSEADDLEPLDAA
jgi:hypothetical protein